LDETATGSTGDTSTTGPATKTAYANDGLPCDIDDILTAFCRSCHGPTPIGGAPQSMTSRADLLAPSNSLPGKTLAEASLDRLTDPSAPMPPAPASGLSVDQIEVWADWIDEGMPAGDCRKNDATNDPFADVAQCSSGRMFVDEGFELMRPGGACRSCHASGSGDFAGPLFTFSGTIYPTAHEPNECFGTDGTTVDVRVEMSDANGQSLSLPVNLAGNFFVFPDEVPAGFDPPWTAKIVANGIERVMLTPVVDGDCNLCHTQAGTQNAPGRLVAP
jgi:hypothetical protein